MFPREGQTVQGQAQRTQISSQEDQKIGRPEWGAESRRHSRRNRAIQLRTMQRGCANMVAPKLLAFLPF